MFSKKKERLRRSMASGIDAPVVGHLRNLVHLRAGRAPGVEIGRIADLGLHLSVVVHLWGEAEDGNRSAQQDHWPNVGPITALRCSWSFPQQHGQRYSKDDCVCLPCSSSCRCACPGPPGPAHLATPRASPCWRPDFHTPNRPSVESAPGLNRHAMRSLAGEARNKQSSTKLSHARTSGGREV